jgi:hypothetical protein
MLVRLLVWQTTEHADSDILNSLDTAPRFMLQTEKNLQPANGKNEGMIAGIQYFPQTFSRVVS